MCKRRESCAWNCTVRGCGVRYVRDETAPRDRMPECVLETGYRRTTGRRLEQTLVSPIKSYLRACSSQYLCEQAADSLLSQRSSRQRGRDDLSQERTQERALLRNHQTRWSTRTMHKGTVLRKNEDSEETTSRTSFSWSWGDKVDLSVFHKTCFSSICQDRVIFFESDFLTAFHIDELFNSATF